MLLRGTSTSIPARCRCAGHGMGGGIIGTERDPVPGPSPGLAKGSLDGGYSPMTLSDRQGQDPEAQHVLPNFSLTYPASSLAFRFVGAPQAWDDPHFAPLDWSVDFWRKCRCVISHSSCLAPSKSREGPVRAFWTGNQSRRKLRRCGNARQ